ncbi:spore germination protein GerW family protein [Streptomyces sp. NPDC046805]|uniref:spore germination protein GerW family protein n=1 Tax=Streptomyces sp. NPDC046805 TaxID=3155134 RepID=UPI0033E250E2
MTLSERETRPAPRVDAPYDLSDAPPDAPGHLSPAHASVALLERLADKLGGRASVTAVYGEPVIADGVTIIPIARIGFGFGGGAGREVGPHRNAEGGGGGGGADARPLGYIEIRDGIATYKPLRAPWSDVVLPLAALLVGGALPKILRRLSGRGRRPLRERG